MSALAVHSGDLGHASCFERAYRDHAQRAHAVALRILRDEAAAEDVVQDVFLRLWRNPKAFDPERGSLASYVVMLTRSRATDVYRARASRNLTTRRAADTRAAQGASAADAIDVVLARERTREVLRLLSDLPSPQRVVVLASAHGMTADEIAAAERIPVGTVKSRIRLGLVKACAAAELAA